MKKKECDVIKEQLKKKEILELFSKIKNLISEKTLLFLPDFDKEFVLTTDASGIGCGAILSQVNQGVERPIAFFSKLFNEAQEKYSTTDKELTGMVLAIEHFRHYLIGRRFKVKSDHQALIYLSNARNKNSRLFRLSLRLQEFDFYVEHVKGILNASDVLSRAFSVSSLVVKKGNRKLCTPLEEDRLKIISETHEKTGHGGLSTMKFNIMTKYDWPGINKMINNYYFNCKTCIKNKVERKNTTCNPIKANEIWEMDTMINVDLGKFGKRNIFSIIDVFSKKLYAFPIYKKSMVEIGGWLNSAIKNHGCPKKIICDRGKEFLNAILYDIAEKNKITLCHGSPYNPSTQGCIERSNRTIKSKLKKWIPLKMKISIIFYKEV